ncbi:MAG: zinc-dependent alcohol dehydrogenase family protein [Halanaerobiaceae bacterium]
MKAAVLNSVNDMTVKEVDIPEPRKDELLIRVAYTGVCGTDRHIFHGEFPAELPLIAGHEIAGVVVETGSGLEKDFTPGDRVAVDPNIYCGVCSFCRDGKVHLCKNLQAVGVTRGGGFAEYVAVPESNVYKLPVEISLKEGAMTEPISCCLHGIDRLGVETGDEVAVLGGGAIGLILAQLAAAAGAARVVISELDERRRETARKLGFEEAVSPEELEEMSPFADAAIEAAGCAPTFKQCFSAVKKGGRILAFGVCPPELKVPVSPNEIFERELSVFGSYINPFVTARAIELLAAGKINVEELITDTCELAEIPEILSRKPKAGSIKTLLEIPEKGDEV